MSTNSKNNTPGPASRRQISFVWSDSRAIYFWVKGIGISRVGRGHWLKAKVLRYLINMGRHSRNLRC